MTDLAEAPAPVLDLRARLDYALTHIADTELAQVIATAGLAAVHDEWQRCRVDLAVQEDVGRAMALRIATLADEVRRGQRKHEGAVAQAQKTYAWWHLLHTVLARVMAEDPGLVERALLVAEQRPPYARTDPAAAERMTREYQGQAQRLRTELANHRFTASEQQGAAQRLCGATVQSSLGTGTLVGPCIRPRHTDDLHEAADGAKWEPLAVRPLLPQQREPVAGDRVRVTVEGDLTHDFPRMDRWRLTYRPGPNGTQIGYMAVPAHATITPLGTNPPAQTPASVFAKVGIRGDGLAATGIGSGFLDLAAQAEQQLHQALAEEAAQVDRVLLGIEPMTAPPDDVVHEVQAGAATIRLTGPGAAALATQMRAEAAAPCWCDHTRDDHVAVTDITAVCRECLQTGRELGYAAHTHQPEQP